MKYFILLFFCYIVAIKAQPNHTINNSRYNNFSVADSQVALTKVGQWGGGQCYDVAVQGSYAYIGNGLMLQVLDISNPANPKVVGELLTESLLDNVIVQGNYVYTISPFQIIDVSNPANPVLVSKILPDPYPPTAFLVQGNYAYIGDFYGFITIVNISDASNPKEVGRAIASAEIVSSIAVKDTVLYATTVDTPGMDIISIANPSLPYTIQAGIINKPCGSLVIRDNNLYMGLGVYFLIYDISNPASLRYVNSIQMGYIGPISIRNSMAYVLFTPTELTSTELAQINISDTNNIYITSTKQYPYGFTIDDPFGGGFGEALNYPNVYIAGGNGLWAADVSKTDTITSASFHPTGWYVNRMTVDSSYHAYLAELYGGLQILDFSTPSKPKKIASYLTNENVMDVAVRGNYAYLDCDSGLQIIDVSNPSLPKFVSSLSLGDTLHNHEAGYMDGYFDYLCLDGTTIYEARKSKKLFAIDVGDPKNPKIKSTFNLRDIPVGMSISNNYLYVAVLDQGVQILNISNSAQLSELWFLTISPLRGITIAKEKLLATDVAKFYKYSLSNPLNPIFNYNINLTGGFQIAEIKASDNYSYIANTGAFFAINISNPDSGKIIFSEKLNDTNIGSFNSVAVSDDLVLTGGIGILIYKNKLVTSVQAKQYNLPQSLELYQNYPNPFNPITLIKYQLTTAAYVSLKIYDVLGREVKAIVNKFQQAGDYTVPFNASGLSSGAYFYKIEITNNTGEKCTSIKKMALIK